MSSEPCPRARSTTVPQPQLAPHAAPASGRDAAYALHATKQRSSSSLAAHGSTCSLLSPVARQPEALNPALSLSLHRMRMLPCTGQKPSACPLASPSKTMRPPSAAVLTLLLLGFSLLANTAAARPVGGLKHEGGDSNLPQRPSGNITRHNITARNGTNATHTDIFTRPDDATRPDNATRPGPHTDFDPAGPLGGRCGGSNDGYANHTRPDGNATPPDGLGGHGLHGGRGLLCGRGGRNAAGVHNATHPDDTHTRPGDGFNHTRPDNSFNHTRFDGRFNHTRAYGGFNRTREWQWAHDTNATRPDGKATHPERHGNRGLKDRNGGDHGRHNGTGFNHTRPDGGFNRTRPHSGFNWTRWWAHDSNSTHSEGNHTRPQGNATRPHNGARPGSDGGDRGGRGLLSYFGF